MKFLLSFNKITWKTVVLFLRNIILYLFGFIMPGGVLTVALSIILFNFKGWNETYLFYNIHICYNWFILLVPGIAFNGLLLNFWVKHKGMRFFLLLLQSTPIGLLLYLYWLMPNPETAIFFPFMYPGLDKIMLCIMGLIMIIGCWVGSQDLLGRLIRVCISKFKQRAKLIGATIDGEQKF